MATLQGLQILLPKKRAKPGGTGFTPTFNPRQEIVTVPTFRQHLTDLFQTRSVNDARTLMNDLAVFDSDVSSAFLAYGTLASSAEPVIKAFDINEEFSRDGVKLAMQLLTQLTIVHDYTQGYNAKLSFEELCNELRYMTLLRGGPACELIVNKQLAPDSVRLVDPASIEWREKAPGVYKPVQKPAGANVEINLDIPTFFTARFHQNPTNIYLNSPFVSSINTVASRQLIINELYRIMQITGYPRMDIAVLEEVILKSIPATQRLDAKATREFVNQQIQSIRGQLATIRSDEPFIHSSAIEAKMINERNPGAGMNITDVISTLDAQNQAALKTMPSVVGKSSNGNVASAESRLFALNCDSLNRIIAVPVSAMLTLAARLNGFQGRVDLSFRKVELRPELELEPQKTMRQSRWDQLLSRGQVTDDEYHLEILGRPRPDSAPELSGTNFMQPNQGISIDTQDVTPNNDPLGRSMAPEGGTRSARSNAVKSG